MIRKRQVVTQRLDFELPVLVVMEIRLAKCGVRVVYGSAGDPLTGTFASEVVKVTFLPEEFACHWIR